MQLKKQRTHISKPQAYYQQASSLLSANSDKMVQNCYFSTIRHRSSSMIPGIPDLTMHCGSDCGGTEEMDMVGAVGK